MKKYLLALGLLSITSLANANLITNGSFEDTHQAAGTWSVYSHINGWSTTQGDGIEIRNNVVGTAQDGVNFVELDSNNNSAMKQIIATSVGASYNLSFYYSPRINQPSSTNGIKVFWDNTLLDAITASGFGLSNNNWVMYTFNVMGTGSDALKFAAFGTNDSLGGNIDNVRLTPTPIPAGIWLLASGLGFLGFGRRKSI